MIDSSPTSTFSASKLDSDSRLNTLGSILSVPENGEYEGAPKSSISDSKLAVDYFTSENSELLPAAECKETDVRILLFHLIIFHA